MTETRTRLAELERLHTLCRSDGILACQCQPAACEVPWLIAELRAAREEIERLRSLLDLPADCGLKTGNAPEITGKGIVWLKDYDELRADRRRLRAVVEAARALATEGRYIAGMADDDPFKGNGNRLVDALAALDAAEGKGT